MDASAFKRFLEQALALTPPQQGALASSLQDAAAGSAAALIDAVRGPAPHCPRCAAVRVHRHGTAHGLQRWRCTSCRRSFNALTGTPLARLRKRSHWLPFLDCMLDSRTVRAAADRTRVHRNTSFRWRHRFLSGAKLDRVLPLGGIVEADETYLLESQKGSRNLDRPARRRGGHATRRGISHEQVCILVARGRDGRTFDCVTGRAPLTAAQLTGDLLPALANDCLLVSDGHPAYRTFARRTGIAHAAVNLRAGVRVKQGHGDSAHIHVHVQNVNAYHSRFKEWLRPFHGVASRYLPNYLGWRWAIDGKRLDSPALLLEALFKALLSLLPGRTIFPT